MVNEKDSRTVLLVGEDAIMRLKSAKVAVIGLGGVGGYAVEALARTGVGELLLVDYDTIQESNLNRQIIAHRSNLGKSKTTELAARIADIDQSISVELRDTFLDQSNVGQIIDGYNYVVDAIDSLQAKIDLLYYCHQQKLTVVSVFGAGRRLDPASIRSGDISLSSGCPLAKRVRKALRERCVDQGIFAVWSVEEAQRVVPGNGSERAPIGSISYMPAIMGLTAASIIIRSIISAE